MSAPETVMACEVVEVRAEGERMQVFGGPADGFRIVKWESGTNEQRLWLRLERTKEDAAATLNLSLDIRDVLGAVPGLINREASKVLR